MSVFLTINLVKKEQDKVIPLQGSDKHKIVELDGFRDLFFGQDQASTMQELATIAGVDNKVFHFFTQSNGESYGDERYMHRSFNPAEVRYLLENISSALENTAGPWSSLYHYIDLLDGKGQRIEEALVEYSGDEASPKYCLAKPYIEGISCFLTIYCDKKQRKEGEINLLEESPQLFTFKKSKSVESITLGKPVDWNLNSFNQIESLDGRVYREVAIPKTRSNSPTSIDDCYLAYVRSSSNEVTLECYDYPSLKQSHTFNLSAEDDIILYSYRVKMHVERKPQKMIDWMLKKERYTDWIKRDIEATLRLCDYAESHGYELQVWQS